jgi:hypothetical protein
MQLTLSEKGEGHKEDPGGKQRGKEKMATSISISTQIHEIAGDSDPICSVDVCTQSQERLNGPNMAQSRRLVKRGLPALVAHV